MFKELLKDFSYIKKTITREFPLMVRLKITFVPVIVGVATFIASWLGVYFISKLLFIPVSAFTIILCLLVVMARKCRKLEERNLVILCDDAGVYRSKEEITPVRYATRIRVGVKNTSLVQEHGVELVLANIVSLDGDETNNPNISLVAFGTASNDTRVTINPHDIRYYTIASFIEPEDKDKMTGKELLEYMSSLKENPYAYIEAGGINIKNGLFRLKLRISSESSPSSSVKFLIGFDENKQLVFKPEDMQSSGKHL